MSWWDIFDDKQTSGGFWAAAIPTAVGALSTMFTTNAAQKQEDKQQAIANEIAKQKLANDLEIARMYAGANAAGAGATVAAARIADARQRQALKDQANQELLNSRLKVLEYMNPAVINQSLSTGSEIAQRGGESSSQALQGLMNAVGQGYVRGSQPTFQR